MIKMRCEFPDIAAETLYDVLHDADYRKVWDDRMISGKVIEMLDSHNEIGYYSVKVPSPLANRDFVTHRRWRADFSKGEWIICNHSVQHKDMPEIKGFVRGENILCGYIITRTENGCRLDYLAQSDLKGWIPSWLINSCSSKFAPSVSDNLHNACLKYNKWKDENEPGKKPWLAGDI
jgi:hypothetical protein